MDDQNKNLILATVLSFLVIVGWLFLFPPDVTEETPVTTAETTQLTPGVTDLTPVAPEIVAAEAPRVVIDTPRLTGTLSLQGARLDDLALKDYRVSLEPGADLIQLLTPVGQPFSYYAVHGWSGTNLPAGALPDHETVWTLSEGEVLTPATPITLTWDGGAGLTFTRVISVDEDFMFTIADSVANAGEQPVTLEPYGFIARHGRPDTPGIWILHEGVVRMTDGILGLIGYNKLPNLAPAPDGSLADEETVVSNGWTGFTDKYWMTTLVPTPGTGFRSTVRYIPETGIFQTFAWLGEQQIAAGDEIAVETHLFAGAKEWEVIRDYQNENGVEGFIDSIDWGWFSFLTKPMFWLLHNLNQLIGNMGWAIIALTFVIKALVLPLAYRSFVSMAKMKELQPQMEKLKENAGEDRQAMQQGMMKLYKDNKVNPAAGCLPILIQIPIFFSLYKVIIVTIELYHAPWIAWIRDLSAPDPSSLFNLFGLLPWAAPEAGSILQLVFLGILPLFLGVSMWLQQKLNPAPPDPTQRMIFAWMPWVFMFMMGGFASGLVIYWITNNLLSFAQQYVIMRSHGAKPDVFGNILQSLKRKPKAETGPAKKTGGK